MLGISGWKSRLCTIVLGLGLYLVVSALISTRKLNFPHHHEAEPHLGDNDQADFPGGPLAPKQQQPPPDVQARHHGPRNLASAAVTSYQQRILNQQSRRGGSGGSRNGPHIDWCRQPLGFKSPPGPTVALASFPGSGNTWLRYLLQQATGILTGSVYKDYALLKNGFPAENISNGSVLVVKTHEFGPEARNKFDRLILLVRDPFASLQAEFNRRSGGHTGHATVDRYKRNGGKYWKNFVNSKGEEWEKMNLAWFHSFGPDDRLVVFYDQLLSSPLAVLKTVLNFLQVSVSGKTLQCVLDRKEGIYKRSKKKLGIEVFNNGMKAFLQEKHKNVYKLLMQQQQQSNFTEDIAKTIL